MRTESLAALKSWADKELKGRATLAPGVYPIARTYKIEINGEVVKSEDNEYTPTADIPIKAALAIVLEKAGFQREHAKALLIEAMQEALELQGIELVKPVLGSDKTIKQMLLEARLKDVDSAMEHVQEVIAALPKKTRSGPTNVRVIVNDERIVDPEPVAA